MLIDARQIEEGAALEADVAIIGAGAFGITLARALIGSRFDVLMLESGGLDPDNETQDLYAGETGGIEYNLDGARLRFFGGSTNHWGGWCRHPDAEDFEARPWIAHSGWPVKLADLEPYLGQAHPICELGEYDYGPEALEGTGPLLDLPGGAVRNSIFQYSPPTRFGERYRDEIAGAETVRCLLHANVTEIVAAHDMGSIRRLDVATLSGRSFSVRARYYVLATGGIENPRLLLASQSVAPAGLCNDHDLVGRYFMEHPIFGPVASWVCDRPELVASGYGNITQIGNRRLRGSLTMTPEYLRETRRLNTIFTFSTAAELTHETDGAETTTREDLVSEHDVLSLLPGRAAGKEVAGVRMSMGCGTEQAPNPSSRVTLAGERDRLGMPRVRLDWQLTDQDRDSLLANIASLASGLGAWGHARMRNVVPAGFDWETVPMFWAHHHMGTTRMAENASLGVVDRNLRTFALPNLYIGGSSVWVTGCGATNPTLSIVAFALRLAEHLKADAS